MSNSMKKSVYNLDVKLTGLETTWRPDGDMSLRSRRDVSWRLRGSRWNRGDIKLVRLKKTIWILFQVSSRYRRCRGDVKSTYCVIVTRETSPRLLEIKEIEEKMRRLCGDVSVTRRRRLRDNARPTFIDLERILPIKEKLKLVSTCKT